MNKIPFKFISCIHQEDGSIDVVVPKESAEEFKLMIRKACNNWPDQSSYIRDFNDRLHQREHIMGINMKWDLPGEDKYEVEVAKQERQIVETPKQETNFYELIRPLVDDRVCPSCAQYVFRPNPACKSEHLMF